MRKDPFSGLTADDVPVEPTLEATSVRCVDHPEAPGRPGFGYAGGGFGSYAICEEPGCGKVFAKRKVKQ